MAAAKRRCGCNYRSLQFNHQNSDSLFVVHGSWLVARGGDSRITNHEPLLFCRNGPGCACKLVAVGSLDRLVEVGEDVANVFNADGKPHQLRRHARGRLLLSRELLMRGGGRMDHQRLGVADVGQQREKLERVDELLARIVAALDAECDQGPGAVGQILFRSRVVGARSRPG